MQIPELPPRYDALELLSRDEVTATVRARDRVLLREVVLKVPVESPFLASTDEAQQRLEARERERLLSEARALARVQHPAIERLLDVAEGPLGPVLVLEPTSGEPLSERLARDGRLAPEVVARLAVELFDALDAVHRIGVLHRGIGVDQVVLSGDGQARLVGFTFAKVGATGCSTPGLTFLAPTASSKRRGPAPPHPAPEQRRGQSADARSDVFGVGWVLYEALTGSAPYPLELDCLQWPRPASPSATVPSASKDLSEAVLRCLAVSPARRFGNAAEARAAFEALAARTPAPSSLVGARDAQPEHTPARRVGRRFGAAAGLCLILVATVALGLRSRGTSPALGEDTQQRGSAASAQRGIAGVRAAVDRELSRLPYTNLHAVVIGIDAYEHWPRLGFAVADARAVSDLLVERFGFPRENVVELLDGDATRDTIRHVLGGKMKGRTGPEDGVFVFFAGHGQTEDLPGGGQTGYLVPVGGSLDEERHQETLIPMGEIADYARKMPAKHVFFALDACFSGLATTTRGMADEDREYVGYLAREPARLVLTAGGKAQQVNETASLGHSYFTHRLLRALGDESADVDRNGVITSSELAAYIQVNVPKDTSTLKNPQVPQYTSLTHDEGQFMFLNAAARAALRTP